MKVVAHLPTCNLISVAHLWFKAQSTVYAFAAIMNLKQTPQETAVRFKLVKRSRLSVVIGRIRYIFNLVPRAIFAFKMAGARHFESGDGPEVEVDTFSSSCFVGCRHNHDWLQRKTKLLICVLTFRGSRVNEKCNKICISKTILIKSPIVQSLDSLFSAPYIGVEPRRTKKDKSLGLFFYKSPSSRPPYIGRAEERVQRQFIRRLLIQNTEEAEAWLPNG